MGTLTKFGKEIRKLRIEHGETMKDMADKLRKAPSFLSSIERGNKTPPASLVEDVITNYNLRDEQAKTLKQAAFESARTYTFTPKRQDDRELIAAFARKLDTLSTSQRDSILQALNKK